MVLSLKVLGYYRGKLEGFSVGNTMVYSTQIHGNVNLLSMYVFFFKLSVLPLTFIVCRHGLSLCGLAQV